MPITSGEIEWRYSVKTGSAGDSTAGTASGSLGKYVSTTAVDFGALFDDVSADENAADDVEYRCIFVLNQNDTLTYQNVKVWIDSETAGGASLAIALDGLGVTPKAQAGAQADEVADEGTAPTGETFTTPTSKAVGLAPADVGPDQCFALWIRRTISGGPVSAVNNDGGVIKVSGETSA